MKWMKIRNGEPHTCALRITTSEQRVWDFPGGPVVKNPPCIAGDSGLIPVWGAKFSHAVEQLSPHGNCWGHTTTRELVCPKERSSLNLSIFLKKREEKLVSIKCLIYRRLRHLTNEHLSRISPRSQANKTAWSPAGLPHLCTPCPLIDSFPKLQLIQHACWACYSIHSPNCNSSATPKSKISGNLRLPQFTYLFRLTFHGVGSGIQGRAPQEGQWLSSLSKVPVLGPLCSGLLRVTSSGLMSLLLGFRLPPLGQALQIYLGFG